MMKFSCFSVLFSVLFSRSVFRNPKNIVRILTCIYLNQDTKECFVNLYRCLLERRLNWLAHPTMHMVLLGSREHILFNKISVNYWFEREGWVLVKVNYNFCKAFLFILVLNVREQMFPEKGCLSDVFKFKMWQKLAAIFGPNFPATCLCSPTYAFLCAILVTSS